MTRANAPKLTHRVSVSHKVYRMLRANGKLWHKSPSRYLDDEITRLMGELEESGYEALRRQRITRQEHAL